MAQRSEDGVGKTSEMSRRLERALAVWTRSAISIQASSRDDGCINRPDTRKHLNLREQISQKPPCIQRGVHTRTFPTRAITHSMSVEHPDVIDGIGLEDAGAKVVMLVSDHLSWDDPAHVPLLVAKIEAYASAALSGQLVSSYPPSEGKPVSVRLVYHDLPHGEAERFLSGIGDQLRAVGIGFEHTPLPHDY